MEVAIYQVRSAAVEIPDELYEAAVADAKAECGDGWFGVDVESAIERIKVHLIWRVEDWLNENDKWPGVLDWFEVVEEFAAEPIGGIDVERLRSEEQGPGA